MINYGFTKVTIRIKCIIRTLKIAQKYYTGRGLQNKVFGVSCECIKRRKCVRMIQPVNASNPQAVFRGSRKAYGATSKGITNAQIAMINAGGVATAIGAGATIISRRYAPSWGYAGMVGLCSMFLTMFFMTPQILEKTGKKVAVAQKEADVVVKNESSKFTKAVKDYLKPSKKNIHFKQS